jgi:hypothetical protein
LWTNGRTAERGSMLDDEMLASRLWEASEKMLSGAEQADVA